MIRKMLVIAAAVAMPVSALTVAVRSVGRASPCQGAPAVVPISCAVAAPSPSPSRA